MAGQEAVGHLNITRLHYTVTMLPLHCYLYELSLFPAVSGLKCEGSVAVERTGWLHPHLRLGVDTLGRLGVRDAAPAGGQQDEDGVEVSPATGGRVQHPTALSYPALNVVDNLTAPALCIQY